MPSNVRIENNEVIIPKNFFSKEEINIDVENSLNITVMDGANVTIIENVKTKASVKMVIHPNAYVKYLTIDTANDNITRDITLESSATLEGIFGYFNKAKTSENLNIKLVGENAEANINTIAYGTDDVEGIFNLRIDHLAKETKSTMFNYGIAEGNARIIYNAAGFIEKGMAKSDAMQKTRGIILSKKAHLEANPSLLISEYDVKANHGATIGKISDEDLYYLMSRGLSKDDAMRLIIDGFLDPILEKISNEKTKEQFKLLAKGM